MINQLMEIMLILEYTRLVALSELSRPGAKTYPQYYTTKI